MVVPLNPQYEAREVGHLLSDSDAPVTADEVGRFCPDSLAEYGHLREVEFVDELPRTTTGR